MVKYTFKFDCKEKVYITELERSGRVVSLWVSERGLQYEVSYFYDGSRHQVYFYEDDLEVYKDQDKKISLGKKKKE